MKIKLSDYIQEQSISDASVEDILLEQATAELDVMLALLDNIIKEYAIQIHQELAAPAQQPPQNTTQVTQAMGKPTTSVVSQAPEGYTQTPQSVRNMVDTNTTTTTTANNPYNAFSPNDASTSMQAGGVVGGAALATFGWSNLNGFLKLVNFIIESIKKKYRSCKTLMLQLQGDVKKRLSGDAPTISVVNLDRYIHIIDQYSINLNSFFQTALSGKADPSAISKLEMNLNELTNFVNGKDKTYVDVNTANASQFLNNLMKMFDETTTKSLSVLQQTAQLLQSNIKTHHVPESSIELLKQFQNVAKKSEQTFKYVDVSFPKQLMRASTSTNAQPQPQM